MNFYCSSCDCIVWNDEGPRTHNNLFHNTELPKESSEVEGDYEGY